MELNLENFNIRNSKPIILGNAGLPKNTERYHLNGMGIIGIDIYKDDKMQIWAHDDKGYHHNFTPADSAQYKLVTNHIGSNLNSIFVGRCNYHGVAEVVIVSPEIISIKTRLANNNSRSSARKNNRVPERVNNGTGVQIIQSTPSPARSFQPVQQTTDTKN